MLLYILVKTEPKLVIETLREGDRLAYPIAGQMVSIDYIGYLPNGTKFDSSYERKLPYVFQLGEGAVIQGWDVLIPQMSKGQKVRVTVPN